MTKTETDKELARKRSITFYASKENYDRLAASANKTDVINAALDAYFAAESGTLTLEKRLDALEDFRNRFLAYFARKDNEPHSEFCECNNCGYFWKSTGKSARVKGSLYCKECGYQHFSGEGENGCKNGV